MFSGATQAVLRFSLLLLEEGELYLEDFVATARWPPSLPGNWQRLSRLPGQLRLCTRSLFFEPDDVRVPIVRCVLWLRLPHVCACLAAAVPRRLSTCLPASPPAGCLSNLWRGWRARATAAWC